MADTSRLSTQRFSGRVEDYIKYRPSYPREVLKLLRDRLHLAPGQIVVDVGSGTGILSQLFLDNGNTVIGVEPNADMAGASKALLAGDSQFCCVRAKAEATGLRERMADLVVAGQAFHWFAVHAARNEFRRILKPGGCAALIWNSRLLDRTPFLRDYEAFLHRWGTDYKEVSMHYADPEALRSLFGSTGYERESFANHQVFDFNGLRGRLLSCSYIPEPSHADFQPMLAALLELFEAHQQDGRIRFEYETELFYGPLAGE